MLRSDVIYQINCPLCTQSYVGQTERHTTARFTEHILREGPVKVHMGKCKGSLKEENISVIMEVREKSKLGTYEAIFLKEIKPEINTKEEFKSKKLHIKWLLDSLFGKE